MSSIFSKLLLNVIIIIYLIVLVSSYSSNKTSNLYVNQLQIAGSPIKKVITKGNIEVFCYKPSSDHDNKFISKNLFKFKLLLQIFDEINIKVITTNTNIPWHAIKGVSNDDLHFHVESIFKYLVALYLKFTKKDSDVNIDNINLEAFISRSTNLYEKHSFVRDIISSCPSPVFNSNQKLCNMRFSAFSEACVTIVTDEIIDVSITVNKSFKSRNVYTLICGIIILLFAGLLAKSKIFQYSSGSLFFVAGGLLLISIILANRLLPRDKHKSLIRDIFFIIILFSSYGASLVWYLRNYLSTIIINYWEYLLVYVIVFSLIGLVFTRMMRRNDNTKHLYTVSVKWLIRIISILFLYNSFSSPFISLLIVLLLMIIYLIYALHKWTLRKIFKKRKE